MTTQNHGQVEGGCRTHQGLVGFLQSDPVLPIGADVYPVRLHKVSLLGLLGNGPLCPHGRDEAQEAQVYLQDKYTHDQRHLQNTEPGKYVFQGHPSSTGADRP